MLLRFTIYAYKKFIYFTHLNDIEQNSFMNLQFNRYQFDSKMDA